MLHSPLDSPVPSPKRASRLLHEAPGLLTAAEVNATAASILSCQLPSGLILWSEGTHADPWNHVEAAMALDATGRHAAAERAYEFLAANQLPDGSWHRYYTAEGVEDANLDANCIAYFASGLWHHYQLCNDEEFLRRFWPTLNRAVDFVLKLQRPSGEVIWARRSNGKPWLYALLSSSSSIYSSLQAAVSVGKVLRQQTHRWQKAAERLGEAIRSRPQAFSPRDRWAMDWYYPVLCGAISGRQAQQRLREGWDRFVAAQWGVRCVADKDWFTPAETAEAAMACLSAGMTEQARNLLHWSQRQRNEDGSYWTGTTLPEEVHFPAEEKTTYTAAAQLLAAWCLVNSPSERQPGFHPKSADVSPTRRRTRSEPVAETSANAPEAKARL